MHGSQTRPGLRRSSLESCRSTASTSSSTGQVKYCWDVINEPLDDDGTWREALCSTSTSTTRPAQGVRTQALVPELKAANVPLHGVGVQVHEIVGKVPPLADVKRNLAEFAALGVEVAITELDVRFVALSPDEERLEQQRRDLETIVRACREVEGCVGIMVWD
uniref:endo-1,4-beta-xylanase n=1 Tax=Ganoderma boninense TaxID=34458 RepID=A0A5K1JXP5_9APHY|nr:Beta-xylanase (EC [Ganoderma boninense]